MSTIATFSYYSVQMLTKRCVRVNKLRSFVLFRDILKRLYPAGAGCNKFKFIFYGGRP